MSKLEGKELTMNCCRICLSKKYPLSPLFKYKLSGNYAEMLTSIANVKVASDDGLPDRLCQKCCTALERAFLLKTIAERTDAKLRKLLLKSKKSAPTKKIAFDSFTEVKNEIDSITIKSEPKWEVEVDMAKPVETIDGKDIVIANTIIKKVDANDESSAKLDIKSVEPADITWRSKSGEFDSMEYLDDDIFQDNNDDDDDYVPPEDKKKGIKFKKPKLSDVKVLKGKVIRKIKVIGQPGLTEGAKGERTTKATTITCYPIMKNGARGPPILLKRPKDATVLKFNTGYKIKKSSEEPRALSRDKVRVVRAGPKPAKAVIKPREKLVCPICGILTFTLGNHIATHQEKKKYNCEHCSKTFAQKGNLETHMKQHTGIKDYICDICGAGFYSQKSLVRHHLIHKGERPYACNLCTKKFIARCDLNRHLRIHAGYKPYKCEACLMSFNAKHQLQNHERMHTGERPYTCQVCNVAFSYKVNLNNHVYKVHGVNLKFKSIHTVTEDVLRKEMGLVSETRMAILQISDPQTMGDVPTPAAHETVHHTSDYN